MSCSKREVYFVTKRLHDLLKTHPNWIVIKKLKGICGLYEAEGKKVTITIDHRKEIIPSLIHEALHHWYPDWSESRVEKHERLIVNALTPSQAKHLIISLANVL